MLNRRLWILFIAFFLGFVALTFRLAKLQLADSQEWRNALSQFVHRHHVIETYRGSILDRNGLILAQDVPSDELAIDYRAMNLDDAWLKKNAIERLRTSGEWKNFPNRAARDRRLDEVKAQVAQQIDAIPDAIARVLAPVEGVPVEGVKEDVLARYQAIRQRISLVKQDYYTRKYNPAAQARQWSEVSSTGDTGDDMDDKSLDELFRKIKLEDEVAAHTIRANIPSSVALYFKQHAPEFPGLEVRDKADRNRRDYPFGEATAHLIGTMRSVAPETYSDRNNRFLMPDLLAENQPSNLHGYLPGDRMGASGVEQLAEDTLRGTRGVGLFDLAEPGPAQAGEIRDDAPKDVRRIDPTPGKDVRLTLDAELQRDIVNALHDPSKGLLRGEDGKDHFVALVILSMDGQLLAAVTYPSYDPNTLDENYSKLVRDTWRTPLVNRAISGAYQPGSTVKPLLAAAALTERVMTTEDTVTCVGHLYPSRPDIFRCDEIHGTVSMVEAIAQSCNIYFYTVGQRMGLERLTRWYGNYGFGSDTGMELGESKGRLPAADADEDRAKTDAIFLGIGQGPISVTPLQLANAYATLLRGGVAIAPRILADTAPQPIRRFEISAATLATVRDGMERCTSEGTAKTIFRNFSPRVAGKTGTAETKRPLFDDDGKPVDGEPLLNPDKTPRLKPDGTPMFRQAIKMDDDAWFVGYTPTVGPPKFIVAAIMEFGGHGGKRAAPLVKEAFQQLVAHKYLDQP